MSEITTAPAEDLESRQTAPENPEQPPEDKSQDLMKKLKRSEKSVKRYQFFVLRLLLLLLVLWVLFFKIVGLTHMPSGDMYPRIDSGDLVLFYRLEHNFKAQDIVVLEKTTPNSGGEKQLYISRVVAVAGDTVEIGENGGLIVNGNTMIESNIFYSTQPYEGYTTYPVTLGPGEVFVLADSRQGGEDSRYFGPVSVDEIQGAVITIVRRSNL